MKKLGFGGRKLKQLVEEVGNEALRTSFWIWFMREEREWSNIGFNKVKDIQYFSGIWVTVSSQARFLYKILVTQYVVALNSRLHISGV